MISSRRDNRKFASHNVAGNAPPYQCILKGRWKPPRHSISLFPSLRLCVSVANPMSSPASGVRREDFGSKTVKQPITGLATLFRAG
jgi:hypothetical protein